MAKTWNEDGLQLHTATDLRAAWSAIQLVSITGVLLQEVCDEGSSLSDGEDTDIQRCRGEAASQGAPLPAHR